MPRQARQFNEYPTVYENWLRALIAGQSVTIPTPSRRAAGAMRMGLYRWLAAIRVAQRRLVDVDPRGYNPSTPEQLKLQWMYEAARVVQVVVTDENVVELQLRPYCDFGTTKMLMEVASERLQQIYALKPTAAPPPISTANPNELPTPAEMKAMLERNRRP